ncbi:DEAD/DEAH box helicase [soil metagenome]
MIPREYQTAAIGAIEHHLQNKDGNPCVELPTGSGKTPVMAWTARRWMTSGHPCRIIVVAHVKELLEQGVEKMHEVWPEAPTGIYCAGLGRKDMKAKITYASIQSIAKKAYNFDPWDVIFVDEAHRIPLAVETQYRSFIKSCRLMNPDVRVVGFTATPYRMTGGPICGPGYVLNEICYRANVGDLIDQGYLCRLSTKITEIEADAASLHIRNGDYITGESEAMMNDSGFVNAAVDESLARSLGRRALIYFCVSKAHAENVRNILRQKGVSSEFVTDDTSKTARASIIERFKSGELRALVNVNVFCEGFDARHVDCIVMLRPTASAGLYYQQVGRGLRMNDDKQNCLILDFAGNIRKHGPIDKIGVARIKVKPCPKCREAIGASADECRECGWFSTEACPSCHHEQRIGHVECEECGYLIIGKKCKSLDCLARNRMEDAICKNCNRPFAKIEREIDHNTKADDASILSRDPEWIEVENVVVKCHTGKSGIECLRVMYQPANFMKPTISEFVCFGHPDGTLPRTKAIGWWRRRFGGEAVPGNATEAMTSNMFLGKAIADKTEQVAVVRDGKFWNLVDYRFRQKTALTG